jgi:hypothetical protein
MGDMDSRIRRAIEQSAAAEAASLLARLRSTAAGGQLAGGDKARLDGGFTGRFFDTPRESPKLPSEAVTQPNRAGVRPRKP